jgi:hypothetical protein
VANEEWSKSSKRVLNPPFSPQRVLDAFGDWFEQQMNRKGLTTTEPEVRLQVEDGRLTPHSRAEAWERVQTDHLVLQNYWEDRRSFNVIEAIEGRRNVRFDVHLWWDFNDNELLIVLKGPDRDEIMGFAGRVQKWLDTLAPDTVAVPVSGAIPDNVPSNVIIGSHNIVGDRNISANHSSVRSNSTETNGDAAPTDREPDRTIVPRAVLVWGFGIVGAVIAGGIIKALGWV